MKKSYLTVTDQFCGAGGSSLGAIKAGAEIRLALNHWKLAIETHNTNFPDTDHDCTDISACDPRKYPSTDILITSPECTNHSLAKGKQRKYQAQLEMFGRTIIDPAEERSRATMWDVPRFAEVHNYNSIIVENVVDARHWRLFDAWLHAMRLLDYDFEIVYLNSMFAHPTPQSRDRMYVVFWKKGNKAPDLSFTPSAYCRKCERDVAAVQCWKNPSRRWGRYGKNRQYLYHCPTCASEVYPYYYCAANAIDWSLPSERICDRARPLKEKTMDRIRVGLEKYGRQKPVYYLVDLGHTHAEHPGKCHSIYDPISPQTSRQTMAFILSMRDTPDYPLKHITEPLPTQSTVGTPYLVEMHGSGTQVRPLTDPLGCVLAGGNHHALVTPSSPFLISYYSGSDQVKSISDPIATVSTHDRHGLVQPINNDLHIKDCYFRMLKSHEIGRAMAFPDTYVVLGNERERVKQFGNAVTPPAMAMILERCIKTFLH